MTNSINIKLNKNGQTYGLTVLTPIKTGQADKLRNTLAKIQSVDVDRAFATTALMHKARFNVIGNTPSVDTPALYDHSQNQYLLFSCAFDTCNTNCRSLESDLDAYLQQMFIAMPQEITLIWGQCVDFPDPLTLQTFQDFVKRHQISGGLFFVDDLNNTAEQVRRSLFEQKRCINFIIKAQDISDPDPAQL